MFLSPAAWAARTRQRGAQWQLSVRFNMHSTLAPGWSSTSRNCVSGDAFGEPCAEAALGERTAIVTQSTIVPGSSGCAANISTPCPPAL